MTEEREIMKKLLADLSERYYRFVVPEGLDVADRMIEIYKVLSTENEKTSRLVSFSREAETIISSILRKSDNIDIGKITDKVIDRLTQSMLRTIRSTTCDIPQEDQE